MKPHLVAAAKQFLADAYEAEHRRAPTPAELTEWSLLQWATIRTQAPRGSNPAAVLRDLSDSTERPTKRRKGGSK